MSTYTYQREYSQEDKNKLDHLLQSSIDKLPCTLSLPIEKFIQHVGKEDYWRAMNYALDFFEISVQYLSCILIALIQKKEEEDTIIEKHEEIIRAIQKIDTKRQLVFGDWVNGIFFPLLTAATERLPNDPLVFCLNENIFISRGDILTGTGSKKYQNIVQIRNDYKGHSPTKSEEIYKEVVYSLEQRIFSMLKAVAPLKEWTYFSCKEKVATNQYLVNLLNGCKTSKEKIFFIETNYFQKNVFVCFLFHHSKIYIVDSI